MTILFVLYYCLFLHDNVVAAPVLGPIQHSTFEIEIEINPSKFVQRSTWSIVWSCLSTVFLCSWVVVHPNIPGPSESMFLARLKIMGCMLIAPELVIVWAARQWFAARDIANRYKKDKGWTTTHGFLVSMGGLMLYKDDDKMIKTLDITTLEHHDKEKRIVWPSITKDEIEDRSKGDFMSKSLAVVQTTWFIAQCLARGVARITLTQMELATLAYSVLNIILCILWWNKPLGLAFPFHVRSHSTTDAPNLVSPSPRPSIFARFYAYFCRRFRAKGAFAPIYILIIEPFIVARSSVKDLIMCDAMPLSPIQFSVPTFYAPSSSYANKVAIFIGLFIGAIFGGIHCVAWSFGFPTVQEVYIWRACAATLVAIPVVLYVIVENERMENAESCFHYFPILRSLMVYFLIVLYCLSRALLIALSTLALRSLPPEALLDFDWSSYIPHI